MTEHLPKYRALRTKVKAYANTRDDEEAVLWALNLAAGLITTVNEDGLITVNNKQSSMTKTLTRTQDLEELFLLKGNSAER